MARTPRKPVDRAQWRPATEADLIAAWEAHKARKTKRAELINHPSAPYVFAPRAMWRRKGTTKP